MAIRMRKAKQIKPCASCKGNGTPHYDIGIGPQSEEPQVIQLCDECMYQLLRKTVKMGCDTGEVR